MGQAKSPLLFIQEWALRLCLADTRNAVRTLAIITITIIAAVFAVVIRELELRRWESISDDAKLR